MAPTLKQSNWIKAIFRYCKHHLLFTLVGAYFVLSMILFASTGINIGIPCLFRLVTGYTCPGCGLSHAFAHLLKLEFTEAWEHNKLIYFVLPAGVFYLIKDFNSFRKSCYI